MLPVPPIEVLRRPESYTVEPGKGWIPTEAATDRERELIKRYNQAMKEMREEQIKVMNME